MQLNLRKLTVLVGCLSVCGPVMAVVAEPHRSLPEFVGCMEVFSEPDVSRLRVTTLFCGSDDDGALPDTYEVRQHVVSVIQSEHKTVSYAVQAMIRSREPWPVEAVHVPSFGALSFTSESSTGCVQTDSGCWFETAISIPLEPLFDSVLLTEDRPHWAFQYVLQSSDRELPLSFHADEIRALRLFTEGLYISLPETTTALTGTAI